MPIDTPEIVSQEFLKIWKSLIAQDGTLADHSVGLRPMTQKPAPVREIPVLSAKSYSNILRCWNK